MSRDRFRRRWVAALAASALMLAIGCGAGGEVAGAGRSGATTSEASMQSSFGGQSVDWPRQLRHTPAPPALGAVLTRTHAPLTVGGTLAPGLVLPVVGGSRAHPLVLTPCGNRVGLTGAAVTRLPPSSPTDPVVVLDAGHGGAEDGTHAPDGTREALRTLQLTVAVREALKDEDVRVVLTRDRDIDTSLGFRVALADALRAELAVSIHLNSSPNTTAPYPGTEVFGSVADPHGRRAAGVLYQAERRYLQQFTGDVGGRWAANRDAGALYRLGQHGDYYYLLRDSHVTWVISESLYLSNAAEAALLARPGVRRGLAGAIATGISSYLFSAAPGSGWRTPIPPAPSPPASPSPTSAPCVDPS